ncbi:MAG: hypothetical protein ACKOJF_12250, partial [Planctomycetaceae bacterium]
TSLALNAGSVSTTQDQRYTGPVTLDAASDLTTLTGRDIFFNGPGTTIRGSDNGTESLVVSSSRIARLEGAVNIAGLLKSLDVAATTSLALNAGSISTTQDQRYTGPVLLDAATDLTTLSGRTLQFSGSLAGVTTAESLRLVVTEINFLGGANSISSLQRLRITPQPEVTGIRVGGSSDSGADVLDLTDVDLAAIAGTTSVLSIGAPGVAGTLPIVVESVTLNSSLELLAQVAGITLTDSIATGPGSQLLVGPVVLDNPGDLTTLSGAKLLLDGAETTLNGATPGTERLVLTATDSVTLDSQTGVNASLRSLEISAPGGIVLGGGIVA